ncbi:MAG: hypothetical protein M3Y59_25460 [Myxococcota bacterium]|nr:hypothetical protein [Myxococcota bacterium]
MIKLLFGRLLPAGAAAVILTSALSPLRPALDAFGAAAIALTGQDPAPVAGGADFGSDLVPKRPQQSKPREQKKKLQELASRLRDPNAPQLKEFQAPAKARSEPRFRPGVRASGTPPRAPVDSLDRYNSRCAPAPSPRVRSRRPCLDPVRRTD